MNYLAHAFLSGTDSQLLVGNFIADSVRGNQLNLFPERIAQGIRLHRLIDTFTDSHPVVLLSKQRLRPGFRKYASVITDVFYDHFLAINFSDYSPIALPDYTEIVYETILAHSAILPERANYFLPYMIKHNWLLGYASLEGINRSLTGLSKRTTHDNNMALAAIELAENYYLYEAEFRQFFPQLQAYVITQIGNF